MDSKKRKKEFFILFDLENEGGFTLIELLIVVGIIAILAAAIIVAIAPGDQLDRAREATVKAHMQSIAIAAHNCRVENNTANCNTLEELGLPLPIEHPDEDCVYNLGWDEGRVDVWEENKEGETGCDPIIADGEESAVTY